MTDIHKALEALEPIEHTLLKQDVGGYYAERLATIRQALEQQRVPTLTDKERAIVDTARYFAKKQLGDEEIGMTMELAPAAYCFHLIAIIERLAATDDSGHEQGHDTIHLTHIVRSFLNAGWTIEGSLSDETPVIACHPEHDIEINLTALSKAAVENDDESTHIPPTADAG